MKAKLISFIISLLFIANCSRDYNPINDEEYSYSYELSFKFNTSSNPYALVIDDENELIYVLTGKQYASNEDQQIQKFNLNGELISKTADFNYNLIGLYPKYLPLDITLEDNRNVCVLLKPYQKSKDDEYWESFDGFCIMIFNSDGQFQEELDFSNINIDITPEAITFKNDTYYVTNSFSLFQISKSSNELIETPLPRILDNTFPEFLISDMVVNGNENIWFAGQTSVNETNISTYIAQMNSECKQQFKFNSIRQTSNYGENISQPGITLDEKCNIYLVTFYCKSLEIYDNTGKFLGDYDFSKLLNENTLPIDVGIDKSNNIYVPDYLNSVIYVLKNIKV